MNIEQGKSHWTGEELETLRSSVRQFMETQGLSQADVSKDSLVASSTLSQFLSGKYAGDNNTVARSLSRWLTAKVEDAQLAKQAIPAPTFTKTENSEKALGVLRAAQALGDIGLVIGPPGCGKTASARQYAATNPRVDVATGSPSIASASAIMQQLIRGRGETPRGRSGASKLELTLHARRLFTAGGLVVIDEAQHLNMEALEELRAIHDETGVGLVLMGNEKVLSRIEGNEREVAFAQLYSRAGVRVKLKNSSPTDVEAVLTTMGVTDAGVVKQALAINAKDSLRVVIKAVRRAHMIATGARENLTDHHLRLAYAGLGGTLAR